MGEGYLASCPESRYGVWCPYADRTGRPPPGPAGHCRRRGGPEGSVGAPASLRAGAARLLQYRAGVGPLHRRGARASRLAPRLDVSQIQERRCWRPLLRHADADFTRARNLQGAPPPLRGARLCGSLDQDAERQPALRWPRADGPGQRHRPRRSVPGQAAARLSARLMEPPVTRIRWARTCRLIPTRYPSVGLFDRVAAPDDLEAVMELEAWTNDRISNELGLLHTIPRDEWVTGRPMASVVMAAFCHPRPGGSRFSDDRRGAWYSARTLTTALAESVHHRSAEIAEVGHFDTRMQLRLYHADFSATFHDVRRGGRALAGVYAPDSYERSQSLARDLLDAGSNGIVYRSVRDEGGECVACFRPALVSNVRVAAHYEYRWEGSGTPRVIRLKAEGRG